MNSRRAAAFLSLSRIPKRPPRSITCRLTAPSSTTSPLSGRSTAGPASGRPAIRATVPAASLTVVSVPLSSKTPARGGAEPSGSTTAAAWSVPKRFSPGFSHESPATLSQPPSALSRASRSSRHF